MIVASPESAANPQPSLTKWDAVLSILPFHIPVSGLFKIIRLESRRLSKSSGPLDDRHVYSVRGGITNYETSLGRLFAYATKSLPNFGQVVEIAGNHQVVRLLASAVQAYFS